MHVVEDDQQRAVVRKPGQETARRPGRFFRPPRVCSQADGGGEPGGRLLTVVVHGEALADPGGELAAGKRGQHVAERRVGDLLGPGAAAADSRRGHGSEALHALDREACLSDPGSTEDGDHVRPGVRDGAVECLDHLFELGLASDDRRLETSEQRRRVGIHCLDNPGVVARGAGRGVAYQPPRAETGEHLARSRLVAQARCFLDRRARDKRIAGHHLTGRQPDPRGRPERNSGASGLQCVVVAGRGNAENADQAAAAEALHGRAMRLEHALGGGTSRAELRTTRFRIFR